MTLTYHRPDSLTALQKTLADAPFAPLFLAGGTETLIHLRETDPASYSAALVDLKKLPELGRLELAHDEKILRLGAALTHTRVSTSATVQQYAPLLAQACGSVAATQIRNRGTLGGNLAGGYPAADSVVALLALSAEVNLFWPDSGFYSRVRLTEYLGQPPTGQPLIVSLEVPVKPDAGWSWQKVTPRASLARAIVNVGCLVELSDSRITSAAIACGALGRHAFRLNQLEAELVGRGVDEAMALLNSHDWLATVEDYAPYGDYRASADYRAAVAPVLIGRALEEALQRTNHA